MADSTFLSATTFPSWPSGASPTNVAVPGGIPAGAEVALIWFGGYDTTSVSQVTSNFTTGDWIVFEQAQTPATDVVAVAYARVTSSPGSPTVSASFAGFPSTGPAPVIAFLDDVTSAGTWVGDIGTDADPGDNAPVVTINSGANMLLLAFESHEGAIPALPSGWTNGAVYSAQQNLQGSRVSYRVGTPGPTTTYTGSGGTNTYATALVISVLGVSGGGGITGTLSATESGSDTIASSGAVRVQGSLAGTESGSDTSAIAGTVLVSGSLAASEVGSDTAVIIGGQVATGSLNATEAGSDTAALSGVVPVSGSLSAVESGADTAALSGQLLVQGSLAVTESGPDTFAATGSLSGGINGSLNAAESGSDSFAATGNVPVAGSLLATESGADSAAISGVVLVQGALSVNESGSDTFSAQGVATAITGYLNAQESGSDTAQILGDGVNPVAGRAFGFELVDHEPASWWKRKPKSLPVEQAKRKVKQVAKAIDEIATKKVEQDEPVKQRDVRAEIAPLLAEMPGFDWRPLFRAIVEFRQAEAARLEAIAQIERIRAIERDDEDVLVLLMSF